MKRISFLLFFILSPFISSGQQLIKGIILSKKDSIPIIGASVMSYSSHWGSISNSHGYFEISIQNMDSIRISAIGYATYSFQTNDSLEDGYIYLEEISYPLNEILIWPYANVTEFKHAFNNLRLPKEEINLNLPESINKSYQLNDDVSIGPTGNGISLDGGLTYLYNLFSKTGKEKRAYAILLANDTKTKFIALKYNKALIKKVTGITEDEQAESLIEYCCIEDHFILAASDYELIQAIQTCYAHYIK